MMGRLLTLFSFVCLFDGVVKQVVEGLDLVKTIGVTKTTTGDKPLKPIAITDAGVLPLAKTFQVNDNPNE